MTKVCIIGVSGYGQIHYELLLAAQAAGEVTVVGATVINQAEESEKCAQLRALGTPLFEDYEVMLEELAGSADLCMIPTGTPLHRLMTVAALQAGMHVLVEKPAAGSLADVRDMQEAAAAAGKSVAVGYQRMFSAAALATKRHILAGAIGEVQSIKCLVMWPRDHAYYSRNGWAGKLTVGGVLVNDSPFNNAVAHELMMMLFLAGAGERNAATPSHVDATLFRVNDIESADTASMRIETAEGVPIYFYATHACRKSFGPEIHIRGSHGSLTMTHEGTVIVPDVGETITIESGGTGVARQEMMAAVLDAVQGGDSFLCDIEIAAHQTMVIDAIRRSCSIHQVAGETIAPADGPASTFIPGIEEALRKAFEAERLLQC